MFHQQPPITYYADRLWNHGTGSGLPTGFTARWATANITWSVQAESVDGPPSNKEIKATITTTGQFCASLDSFGQKANVDVVAMVQLAAVAAGAVSAGGVACRVSGGAGTENGYVLSFRTVTGAGSRIRLTKIIGGAAAVEVAFGAFTWTSATQYYLRQRVIGTTHWGKAWAVGSPEPATWQINAVTDSSITGAGYVGLYASNLDSDPAFGYIAAAAGGVPAPVVT